MTFAPPRPAATPTIYAYASTHPDHAGLLKVGYTERVAADRIAEQFPSGLNGVSEWLVSFRARINPVE